MAKIIFMKASAAESLSKKDLKYATMVEHGLMELRSILDELRRTRENTERYKVSSGKLMKETWTILRRVEATL